MAFKASSWFVCCHDSQCCPFLSSWALFPSFTVWGFWIAWRMHAGESPCWWAGVQEQRGAEQTPEFPRAGCALTAAQPLLPSCLQLSQSRSQLWLAGPWPWLLPATALCPPGLGRPWGGILAWGSWLMCWHTFSSCEEMALHARPWASSGLEGENEGVTFEIFP